MGRRRKLGELLVGDRVITTGERTRALENQAIYGGRIGTNLVDLDFIALEQVGQYLSVQLGVPLALGEDLLGAPAEVLPLLTREQCQHYVVFPLRLEGDWLHLALLDPHDGVTLKELGLLTRTQIKPYVTPELLLLQALEKRYGIRREKRFLRTPSSTADSSQRRPVISLLMAAPAHDMELDLDREEPDLTDEQAEDVFADGDITMQWERPTVQLSDADASFAALARARDRDTVINHLIQAVDPRSAVCVLFMVRGTVAVAHAATSSATREQLERLVLPLDQPSLLEQAHSTGEAVLAMAGTDPFQQAVARHLGWPDPGEVCVAPVALEGKVVNLLCVQATASSRFEDGFSAAVSRLCHRATEAYQRLVQRHTRPGKKPRPPRSAPANLAPPTVRPTLYDPRFFVTADAGTRSFARVWRAVDTSTQKVVAIYALPADLGSEETQRVTAEALRLQKLSHPTLPRLHGTGITEEGMTYVVAEWIDGIDLRARLDSDPVPPRPDVARLVQALADGLEAAHGAGLVHGDVTPHNVLLVAPDHRRVKLVNFGITCRTGGDRYLPAPEYSAPELSAGSPMAAAADVYSLGVIAHEMLAGRRPEQEIDPRRPPVDLAAVPSAAQKIIVRALSPDPGRRPGAGELGRELARALKGPRLVPPGRS